MLLFSSSLYSCKTMKRHHHDALSLSQKDTAQSFEIPPGTLGDALKKCTKTETNISWMVLMLLWDIIWMILRYKQSLHGAPEGML
jgi:hypothetical protein